MLSLSPKRTTLSSIPSRPVPVTEVISVNPPRLRTLPSEFNFIRLLNAADLPPTFRLYNLRHTAATLALAAGVPPKVVSEMLGHASAAFTLDVYSHVLPHMQDSAIEKVEALLKRSKRK